MIKSYFQCFVYDEDYSYLRQSRKHRSRSFVQGFLKYHYNILNAASASISITEITGVNESVQSFAYVRAMNCTSPGRGGWSMAFSNASTYGSSTTTGIVVGTGTTAVAPTDFALATQILDGTSSGTLEHFPSSGTNFNTSGSTASFDLERLFRNSSGGSITINEAGVYCVIDENSSVTGHICLIRDIVSPGFVVNNGEYMRIVYTISVTA